MMKIVDIKLVGVAKMVITGEIYYLVFNQKGFVKINELV